MVVEGNVGLAFGLVIAAGACTCLGACMVFCTDLANHRVLSGALGASAGVMIYVSMVEIFTSKAVAAFAESGMSDKAAMRYATLAFFLGVAATWLLSKLVHWLAHLSQALKARRERKAGAAGAGSPALPALCCSSRQPLQQLERGTNPLSPLAACLGGKQARREAQQQRACDVEAGQQQDNNSSSSGRGEPAAVSEAGAVQLVAAAAAAASAAGNDARGKEPSVLVLAGGELLPGGGELPPSPASSILCDCCEPGARRSPELEIPQEANPEIVQVLQADQGHTTELARMGVLTGLAVGLHNLPEGLATFVATLASPGTGVAIAVAIALHNIPEGVVVAMPIYYATGSRWKGLLWSAVSGAAEPLGGLLAYAILAGNGMHPLAFAIMFAFVAGMMVYISLRELLPTALRYDPEDRYATAACFGGMVVMAASLLLFSIG